MIQVVHVYRDPFDLYIGRAFGRFPASKWKNPYYIGRDGTREQVLEKYERHVRANPYLLGCLKELENLTLGCWCPEKGKPLSAQHSAWNPLRCHGQVLAILYKEFVK